MIDELTTQRRGLILGVLRQARGVPTTGPMLALAVKPFYASDEAELVADVDYLVKAALVERTERKLQGQITRLYALTALGYRVVDGAVADPGVAPPGSAPSGI